MTLLDLVTLFRDTADDSVAPYLWSDVRVKEFANTAQIEACRRARLLLDSTTTAVCQVSVTANSGWVPLDDRVIFVRRVRLASQSFPMKGLYRRDMEMRGDWESETGTPIAFIADMQSQQLRLYPINDANETVMLTVVRTPLVDMTVDADVPEIPSRYHRQLVYYMLSLAYSMRDSGGDASDDKLSAFYENKFAEEFGPSSSAQNEIYIAQEQGILTEEGGLY